MASSALPRRSGRWRAVPTFGTAPFGRDRVPSRCRRRRSGARWCATATRCTTSSCPPCAPRTYRWRATCARPGSVSSGTAASAWTETLRKGVVVGGVPRAAAAAGAGAAEQAERAQRGAQSSKRIAERSAAQADGERAVARARRLGHGGRRQSVVDLARLPAVRRAAARVAPARVCGGRGVLPPRAGQPRRGHDHARRGGGRAGLARRVRRPSQPWGSRALAVQQPRLGAGELGARLRHVWPDGPGGERAVAADRAAPRLARRGVQTSGRGGHQPGRARGAARCHGRAPYRRLRGDHRVCGL
mmetsp:Transcript_14769/g.37360  ORF Transcript_14769/g.37360 Transcript_14769/m.37360 type:complete len:302 (+) Transcript_14769:806-1711(+)